MLFFLWWMNASPHSVASSSQCQFHKVNKVWGVGPECQVWSEGSGENFWWDCWPTVHQPNQLTDLGEQRRPSLSLFPVSIKQCPWRCTQCFACIMHFSTLPYLHVCPPLAHLDIYLVETDNLVLLTNTTLARWLLLATCLRSKAKATVINPIRSRNSYLSAMAKASSTLGHLSK